MALSNSTNRSATRSGKTATRSRKAAMPETAMPETAMPEMPETAMPETPETAETAMPEMAGPTAAEVAAALFQQGQALTIKGCSGNTQKAKPQRKMLRRIASIGVHPGSGLGIKRWHLYRVGMTIQEAKTVPGLCQHDLTFWEKHGLIKMRECTELEYEAEVAAWEAGKPKAVAAA